MDDDKYFLGQQEYMEARRQELLILSQAIINGELGVVEGTRQILPLLHDLNIASESEFLIFQGVDSETVDLALGDERDYRSKEVLSRKDAEMAKHEVFYRNDILVACEKLLKRYKDMGPDWWKSPELVSRFNQLTRPAFKVRSSELTEPVNDTSQASVSTEKKFRKGTRVKFGDLVDGDKFRDEAGDILSKFPSDVLPADITTNAINPLDPDRRYFFKDDQEVEFIESTSGPFPYYVFDTIR
jgi:hypothetical protein